MFLITLYYVYIILSNSGNYFIIIFSLNFDLNNITLKYKKTKINSQILTSN